MKKWFVKFMSVVLIVGIILSVIMYKVDPYNAYRWSDNKWMSSRFLTSGIIKNYDSDYMIIGSSMIQNMQMEWFKDVGYEKPVKLTKGGMDTNEQLLCLKYAKECSAECDMLINIDMHGVMQLDEISPTSEVYPLYLFNNNLSDDYLYIFGYEAWAHYVPINMGISFLDKCGVEIPEKVKNETDVEKIEEWIDDYKFGEDVVVEGYLTGKNEVSKIEKKSQTEINKNIDDFVLQLKKYLPENKNITVAFPPYSILYWSREYYQENMDDILNSKEYLIEKLLEVPQITIIDLQSIPEIYDLNNYKDTTHYNLDIQKLYADSVLEKSHRINDMNDFMINKEYLLNMVYQFMTENSELF